MSETLGFRFERMRMRRARAIISYWKDGRLILENYLSHVVVAVDPAYLRVLNLFECWQTVSSALESVPEESHEDVRKGIGELLKRGFLLSEDTEEAKRDETLEQTWADWLPYGAFHFATKDVNFVHGAEKENLYAGYVESSAPPSSFKTYSEASNADLPSSESRRSEFLSLLLRRRTHREYGRSDIPLTAIAELLQYTWGVKRSEATPLGELLFKTSPSGGARHPIEVYVAALKVDGLKAGLYHYATREHRLELIREGACSEEAVEYCAGQEYVRDAAALFIMTAVFGRSMWKYRFARAYRVVTLDAGHLGQTFCLLATELGLAPFSTAALNDSLIERDLQLDGISESVIYVVGVGTLPS